MSLHPRYSLLTLLVLTALVAGGVKLWYGPHHVVERKEPFQEFEYTFTRDWQGKKSLHGFCICRSIDPNNLNNSFILILCYRQGVELEWKCCYSSLSEHSELDTRLRIGYRRATFHHGRGTAKSLLTPAEFVEFQRVIEHQNKYLQFSGYKLYSIEYIDGFGETEIEKIKGRLGQPFSHEFD
jgi:hypothetical protein